MKKIREMMRRYRYEISESETIATLYSRAGCVEKVRPTTHSDVGRREAATVLVKAVLGTADR